MHNDSYINITDEKVVEAMVFKKSPLDCLRFANGNVLSKSINGRMEYWDLDTEKVIRTMDHESTECTSNGI